MICIVKGYLVNYGVWGYGVLRHFQHYFSYIVSVSFIGGEIEISEENHRPMTCH
jgi:hypothetical protein